VTAPRIAGRTLEFFFQRRDMGGVELLRASVNLDRPTLQTAVAGAGAGDPVAQARAALASDNPGSESAAIDALVERCGAGAAGLLAETARTHKRPTTRAQASLALGRCHDGDSVAALTGVLAGDADAQVRGRAASALGVIGDAAARPALERALSDSDPGVQYIAKKALKKLK
jgi:HEAT repeat protein